MRSSKPLQAPGRLYGLTNWLGFAGDFTGCSDYFGTYHLFTRDGIYVGMLMRDPRAGGGLGPDVTASETITGQLVKPDGMNRYFLLAGAGDARATEISGLDTVKKLPGGTLDLTAADAKLAVDALDSYNAHVARRRDSLSISARRKAFELETATAVSKTRWMPAVRSSVRAAYDAQNLYLDYDVTSLTESTGPTRKPTRRSSLRARKSVSISSWLLTQPPTRNGRRPLPAMYVSS